MIQCTPIGICSWDFKLSGATDNAILKFNWLNEQGTVTVNGHRFNVNKHGMLSGKWTLDQSNLTLASAQKGFTRSFDVRDETGRLTLVAESPFGRSFAIRREGVLIARIVPKHLFTRRSEITLIRQTVDFTTTAFMFWLVLMTWRRAANNNNNNFSSNSS